MRFVGYAFLVMHCLQAISWVPQKRAYKSVESFKAIIITLHVSLRLYQVAISALDIRAITDNLFLQDLRGY